MRFTQSIIENISMCEPAAHIPFEDVHSLLLLLRPKGILLVHCESLFPIQQKRRNWRSRETFAALNFAEAADSGSFLLF